MGPARWLEYYTERFAAVEVNNAFYRLPEKTVFERWAAIAPADFVVAVKASRYLTHVKRLSEPAEPVARLLERASGLGDHLGPVLLQLPPTMRADPQRLDETLAAFGGSTRVAVEPRHASWFVDDVRRVLEARGAALCLADGGPVDFPTWRTADWTYVRFHRGAGRPQPCYLRRQLVAWAGRLSETWGPSEDVYCFFNNDTKGCALRDARWFAAACNEIGYHTTRVPGPDLTHVG
jgi:uncharacterized protein YecE (DUF72 family)